MPKLIDLIEAYAAARAEMAKVDDDEHFSYSYASRCQDDVERTKKELMEMLTEVRSWMSEDCFIENYF